jgi:hypothetical protein
MTSEDSRVVRIAKILCGELFTAMGFSGDGTIARGLTPIVWNPIYRFSEIAVGFDQRVRTQGFQYASQWILPKFISKTSVSGNVHIPKSGPLLIASNHPGAYDALVIAANIPRDDIKIIVNIPLDFIEEIPHTLKHFLYAPLDPHIRLTVVRSAIYHLRNGGALLLFASGGIDPDPAFMPGSENIIKEWSRSLEIFLRQVPDLQILITMIGGILSPKYINHPLTILRKSRRDKQRISEFLQIIHQMVSHRKFSITPKLTLGKLIDIGSRLGERNSPIVMADLIDKALKLFEEHKES